MTHSVIAANRYLTLATCHDNIVWAAPLAYVYNEGLKEFYFYSSVKSKHAQHVAQNPKAVITLFDSQAPSSEAVGLQIEADVEMIEGDKLQEVMDLYFEISFPDPAERKEWARSIDAFSGEAEQRFYRIKPIKSFVNANQDMIDFRKEVQL